jgi:hypothetical protein
VLRALNSFVGPFSEKFWGNGKLKIVVVNNKIVHYYFKKSHFYLSKMNDLVVDDDNLKFAVTPKLFGKRSYEAVQCSEHSLSDYLSVKSIKAQVYTPYTAGKYQKKRFQKVNCPITERFTNMLMVGTHRQNGKKQ